MYKILFVDDEPSLLRIYEEEFSEEGYGVLLAPNGKEALDILARDIPHLVVLDIRMPTMDGVEALVAMLGKNRTLPVILYSAFPEYRENFLTWGAEAFIQKSKDLAPLKKMIRELLEKSEKRETSREKTKDRTKRKAAKRI
jgi:two-component system, response regulator, stage 0 sporulation protein F